LTITCHTHTHTHTHSKTNVALRRPKFFLFIFFTHPFHKDVIFSYEFEINLIRTESHSFQCSL